MPRISEGSRKAVDPTANAFAALAENPRLNHHREQVQRRQGQGSEKTHQRAILRKRRKERQNLDRSIDDKDDAQGDTGLIDAGESFLIASEGEGGNGNQDQGNVHQGNEESSALVTLASHEFASHPANGGLSKRDPTGGIPPAHNDLDGTANENHDGADSSESDYSADDSDGGAVLMGDDSEISSVSQLTPVSNGKAAAPSQPYMSNENSPSISPPYRMKRRFPSTGYAVRQLQFRSVSGEERPRLSNRMAGNWRASMRPSLLNLQLPRRSSGNVYKPPHRRDSSSSQTSSRSESGTEDPPDFKTSDKTLPSVTPTARNSEQPVEGTVGADQASQDPQEPPSHQKLPQQSTVERQRSKSFCAVL